MGVKVGLLALQEQHRLNMLQIPVPRSILEPKRDEMVICWKKLNKNEFHNLYTSPNIFKIIKLRRMRWAGHVARIVKKN
jgi:hypothetical protein